MAFFLALREAPVTNRAFERLLEAFRNEVLRHRLGPIFEVALHDFGKLLILVPALLPVSKSWCFTACFLRRVLKRRSVPLPIEHGIFRGAVHVDVVGVGFASSDMAFCLSKKITTDDGNVDDDSEGDGDGDADDVVVVW